MNTIKIRPFSRFTQQEIRAFELALRSHDETSDSDHPGVFLGLVGFAAALDSVLTNHLETTTVFKGT